MTLFKQIASVVSAIFVLLFVIVLAVSFTILKESAKKSLYENAQNSATSISLSIDNLGADLGSIKTVVSASFDNGNYEKIEFVDSAGEIQCKRAKEEGESKVPEWFKEIVNIEPIVARSDISSGWNPLGVIEVSGDRAILYHQLYDMFFSLLFYLGIAIVGSLILLHLLFTMMLKPLFMVRQQAEAIMANKFIVQEKMPFTKEFRAMTESMNSMVQKVEHIFNNANDALKENTKLLYVDHGTELHNRRYFALKAGEYIFDHSGFSKGVVAVLGVTRADLLNKLIGYKNTDSFFMDIANELTESFGGFEGSLIARLNGSEFVAMIPTQKPEELKRTMALFAEKAYTIYDKLNITENGVGIGIGFCKYGNEENIGKLFSKIDYTLSQAKLSRDCDYCVFENEAVDMGREEWREVLKEAIKKGGFRLIYENIVDINDSTIAYQDLNFHLQIDSKVYTYNEFIAPVTELRMLADVYMSVLKRAINQHGGKTMSVYLPFYLIECTDTYHRLREIFESIDTPNKDVIFEISEDALMKRYDCSVHTIELVRSFGYEFAIANFIASSDDYTFLKDLRPKYVKTSKNFLLDRAQNVNLLKIIMESIGLGIIVTDIEGKEEVDSLKKLGVRYIKPKL